MLEQSTTGSFGYQGQCTVAPVISLVVPVYKEEDGIRPFLERAVPVLERLGSYEVIFCLDPSPDRTEAVIRTEIEQNGNIGLLVFSRRFGQAASTMAGILNCRGEWCAIIDVDLQDPPEVIEHMLMKASEGYDVVTARRVARQGETKVKMFMSELGYRAISRLAEVSIPRNTGDFRLISRRVIEELRGLSESHGFLRGLVAFVGFPQAEVLYKRDPRQHGCSKYNRYIGSLTVAFNGLVGFSTTPLHIMMWTGFGIALSSALAVLVVIALKIINGNAYPMGIPTITVLVLFMGGVQLAAAGLLGEYIGRIYQEVRRRPLYVVDHTVNMTVCDPRRQSSGSDRLRFEDK